MCQAQWNTPFRVKLHMLRVQSFFDLAFLLCAWWTLQLDCRGCSTERDNLPQPWLRSCVKGWNSGPFLTKDQKILIGWKNQRMLPIGSGYEWSSVFHWPHAKFKVQTIQANWNALTTMDGEQRIVILEIGNHLGILIGHNVPNKDVSQYKLLINYVFHVMHC